MAPRHVLERVQVLPRRLEEIFGFFENPENLEEITPGFLRFRIETPRPISMGEGTVIDYRLRILGLPQRWRSRIHDYVPGERFRDLQLEGPYAFWDHLHEFERTPTGTRIRDRVEYELPLGPLGELAHALFVRRMLRAIFAHRHRRLEALFPPAPE